MYKITTKLPPIIKKSCEKEIYIKEFPYEQKFNHSES